MTATSWLFLFIAVLIAWPAAAVLLMRRLQERHYVHADAGPRWLEDVPDGNGEHL